MDDQELVVCEGRENRLLSLRWSVEFSFVLMVEWMGSEPRGR